jgi:hypothetical protein
MLLKLMIVAPLLLAVPEVVVKWSSPRFEALRVQVRAADGLLDKCVKGGLAMEYRYEVRLCRRLPVWFDACAKSWRERRQLSYDAISSSYHVESDRYGDEESPEVRYFSSFDEARKALAAVEQVPVSVLAGGRDEYLSETRSYVGVRVYSECKGDTNRTVARISSILTLGLLRLSGFDTGWVDFKMERSETEKR